MQTVKEIVLCEHDGIFFDGVPRNVVLIVTFFNGSKIRVPYSADKPISALYEDLNAISPAKDQTILTDKFNDIVKESGIFDTPVKTLKPQFDAVDKSFIIEKEDIVKLIMLDPGRNKDATCLLVLGQELRVQTIRKSNNMVTSYEVVDDHSPRPERTTVFPQEVILLRKRTPPSTVLELKIEEILPCPSCTANNALVLEGSEFKGVCANCQQDIVIARIFKKCTTKSCVKSGQEVSCFDVGGKYEGKCNKCGVHVEVPYA